MDLRGKRVLVMGLGLQGSGMAAARYTAQQGAIVRVTDLKSPKILAPSVQALAGLPIEFVLGEHRPTCASLLNMARASKWRSPSSSLPAQVALLE